MSAGDRFWQGLDRAFNPPAWSHFDGRRSGFGPGFALGVLLTLVVLLVLHEVTR